MMKLMRMLKMAKMKRPWSKSWKPQQQLDIRHIVGPISILGENQLSADNDPGLIIR